MSEIVKGYKVFNPDWTCRGFQYEVGKEYFQDGEVVMDRAGFHFCQKPSDCFSYYMFDPSNKVAEVEAFGLVKTRDTKAVTNHIRIVREIPWQELLTIVNVGKYCTGLCNVGNYNTGAHNVGSRNAGHWNSGSRNTGELNTGHWNSGSRNKGHHNSGDYNIGRYNTGDWNTGNYNTGDYNTGDWNSGFFNTGEPFVRAFNKPTDMLIRDFYSQRGIQILHEKLKNAYWICSYFMTDEEKAAHPEHETTGGYLKILQMKEAFKIMWEGLQRSEREDVCTIPNFDAEIFKEITGIDVKEGLE